MNKFSYIEITKFKNLSKRIFVIVKNVHKQQNKGGIPGSLIMASESENEYIGITRYAADLKKKRKKTPEFESSDAEPRECVVHITAKNDTLSITVCDLERLFEITMDEKKLGDHVYTKKKKNTKNITSVQMKQTGCSKCSWPRYFEMLWQTLHLSKKGQSDGNNDNKENEPNGGDAIANVYIEMGKGAAHVILHLDYFVDHSITLPGQIQLNLVDSFLRSPVFQHQKIISLFKIAMSCNEVHTPLAESTESVERSNAKEIKNEQSEANVPLCQYLQVKKQLDDLQLKIGQMIAQNSQLRDTLSQVILSSWNIPFQVLRFFFLPLSFVGRILFNFIGITHIQKDGGLLSNTFGLDTLMPAKNKSAPGPKKTKKDMDVINPRRKKQRTAGGFKFGQ
ncbi:hypothetical protein RFI_07474 [Reticulomyxa filosa]|uniref:Uncharacterized protein n=1 Tax=Reticulomyxa filosa TaxID=46433 RepID=X6NUR0_RETFI|nr:hypothetical protein RFI_07474 [Reticulomyxa filosa]|eukprot:ETO29643.1 hypothetical protein RFI_07474 [Reticulomyxa filosa]